MSKKNNAVKAQNNAVKAQNESVNVVANNTAEQKAPKAAEQKAPEAAEMDPVAQAKKEAQELMERAKEAAKKAKEAAAEAKKAAQAAKVFTSRPKRLATWAIKSLDGAELTKSDVHYVAEKYGIDYVAAQREAGESEAAVVLVKRAKDTQEETVISNIYVDENGHITID